MDTNLNIETSNTKIQRRSQKTNPESSLHKSVFEA
jgi:hypothetical protein